MAGWRIPLIAREAAGLAPINNPDDAGRAVLRDYFRETIAQNKKYQSKVNSLKYGSLYTPQSYLDMGEAKQIIVQVGASLEIEQSQEDAFDSIAERCKTRIKSLDWSERYKERFIKGFDESHERRRAVRRRLLVSEKEFLNSVRDLYMFVLDKHQYFRRSGDSAVIVNTGVRDEFNQRIDHTNEMNREFQAARKLYQQNENEGLSKLGLSAHDFGESE